MLNIGLVDDHLLFRQSLKNIIDQRRGSDMQVITEATNGDALKTSLYTDHSLASELQLVLLDLRMPVMDGKATAVFLRSQFPAVKIIGLSSFCNEYLAADFLRHGGHGFVSKSSDIEVLFKAIDTVMNRKTFIDNYPVVMATTQFHETLSEKQVTFLRYCVSEMSYKEIAERMCLSPKTIDNYRDDLFKKLQIKSRTGLVLYAIKAGLGAL